MNTAPISPVNNNRPSFSGCVHKSVIKLVNQSVNSEIRDVLEHANRTHKPVDTFELENVKWLGNSIINNLKEVMSKFHPATVLKSSIGTKNIDNFCSAPVLNFSFYNSLLNKSHNCGFDIYLTKTMTGKQKLMVIDPFVKYLITSMNPKTIDDNMYNEYARGQIHSAATLIPKGIIGQVLINIKCSKADDISKSFGKPADISSRIKELCQDARNLKKLKEENRAIARKYFQ